MINRVTQQTVQRSTLANLQLNLSTMSALQGKLSGGKTITKPSDDPGGTAKAMQLRASVTSTEQFSRNADDGVGWLSTVDAALQGSLASLQKARDLTVQGSTTGTMSANSRNAIATELEGIRDALLDQANASYVGRSVFAGTSNAGKAFDRATYAWTGTPGSTVERRLTADSTVRADSDGVAAFGQGATSVFAVLDSIASDLRAGAPVTARLADIDASMQTMLGELAGVGTRYGQMVKAQASTQDTLAGLKAQLTGVEDIDFAAVIVQIKTQEVAYQAALGATARVLQPTLMDFLR